MSYQDVEWVSGETSTATAKFQQMLTNARLMRERSFWPKCIGSTPFVSRGVAKAIGATNPSAKLQLYVNGSLEHESPWFGDSATWGQYAAFNRPVAALPEFHLVTVELRAVARAGPGGAEIALGPVGSVRFFRTPDHGLLTVIGRMRLMNAFVTEYDVPVPGCVNVRLAGLSFFTSRLPMHA